MSAKVVLLDRVLAHYGPDAKEARDLLNAIARIRDTMSSQGRGQNSQGGSARGGAEIIYEKNSRVRATQRRSHSLKIQALSIAIDLGKATPADV